MELLISAAAAWKLWKGEPFPHDLEGRELGHPNSYCPEIASEDKGWPDRSRELGAETIELTQVPVKVRHETVQEAAKSEYSKDYDVVIVGGAAAGLSVSACCKKLGLSCLVVEKNEKAGDIWRSRYHRLHLHDIVENCHLPYFDMPGTYPCFPSREQFAQYLEAYENLMELNVKHLSVVTRAEKNRDDTWKVQIKDALTEKYTEVNAKTLVIAYGIYNDPIIPKIPGLDSFAGKVTHSCRYTNAKDLGFAGKEILVVGWGNSGCEIACDLVEHGAKPTILIRSSQCVVPRSFVQWVEKFSKTHVAMCASVPFGWISILVWLAFLEPASKISALLTWGDLSKYGIKQDMKGIVSKAVTEQKPPLMDVGMIDAVKDGKLGVVNTEIDSVTSEGIKFKDGTIKKFDGIVFATGYEQFQAHKHWMDPKLLEKTGTGVDAILSNKLYMGNESVKVPGLYACYGNLIMINGTAQRLAQNIRDKLDGKNLLIRDGFKAAKTVAQHLVVALLIKQVFKRYSRSRM